MTPASPNPSTEITYEKCKDCFESEALRLVEIFTNPVLSLCFDEKIINGGPIIKKRPIKYRIARSGQIKLDRYNSELWGALAKTQIVVCCSLFNNYRIAHQELRPVEIRRWVYAHVEKEIEKLGEAALNNLSVKLQLADTVRCIQLLRELGLFGRTAVSSYQLSLGAFDGARDLNGIHVESSIQINNNFSKNSSLAKEFVFKSNSKRSKHTVLLDADPQIKYLYQQMNAINNNLGSHGSVLAIQGDANKTLADVASAINGGRIKKRNLIVAFRIDHRMIPDVASFFAALSKTITDSADFILSIGAGDNVEQFEGRKYKINELINFLYGRGMSPIRITMHKEDGALEQQRSNPLFGIGEIASYELIHCKLKKKLLEVPPDF